MESLYKVLCKRDGVKEAKEILQDMISQVHQFGDDYTIYEEVLSDYGLEPDYIMDLIDYAAGYLPYKKIT
jgi:hypothetical protein